MLKKEVSSQKFLLEENANLRSRLENSEQAMHDILAGESDALFVEGDAGNQLFTLNGADQSYRVLIENIVEGALTLSSKGLVLYSNRQFAQMLGTPLEKVIGSQIQIWFEPDSRKVLQALLDNHSPGELCEELTLSAADGTAVPIYLSLSRLSVEGIPDSYCVVATDLTKQKRSEAMLAEERLSRAVLEQAADVIVICDGEGRIKQASKKARFFHGTDVPGKMFDEVFPLKQPDGSPFPSISSPNRNFGKSKEVTLESRGKIFSFLVSVGHLAGTKNELLGSVVTMTDITEHLTQKYELKRNEKQLAEALTIAKIGYWEYGVKADEFIFNDQYYLLHETTAEAAGGYRMSSADFVRRYIHPDDAFRVRNNIQLALGSDNPDFTVLTEIRILTAAGKILWVEVRFKIEKDSQGNTVYMIGINQDITVRKLAEARVASLNRVYAVLSGINTLIVRARDRDELFNGAGRIAAQEGGFLMAMLCTLEPETNRIVPIVPPAGDDQKLLAEIYNLLNSDGQLSNTMIARAIVKKAVIISNDSVNDPLVPRGKKLADYGIRSIIVLPMIVAGEAVGALALYAREMDFFQIEEVSLLEELAGDISFAIDHLDKQARLEYLAYYDELTGLANRRLFLDRVAHYMHTAEAEGHKLAVIQMDLERFKSINDSLGREAGDDLLRQVAEWLRINLEDVNQIARMETDHFALVIPEVQLNQDLPGRIETTMAAFSQHQFRLNDAVFRINAKAGIALFPDDGAESYILLRNAEAALKKAKSKGARYLFHTSKMTEKVIHKLNMENQLRQAIDNEEFVLYYQPKVNLAIWKVTGAEALIRWNKPDTGLIPPGEFIPILEETGLIHEVGRWALHKAVSDFLNWRKAGLASVRIAVNVSALQLRNPIFIDEIHQVLALGPHSVDGLELEITEGLIMEDIKRNIASLEIIRSMGIPISIDDFGTGFSSLSYLARLPVDTLKIDRSFITDMTVGPEGLSLVSTIISLAHSMNLKVIAEGVETEEQSHLLNLLRCDELQGFLFSKPVPEDIFQSEFLVPVDIEKIKDRIVLKPDNPGSCR